MERDQLLSKANKYARPRSGVRTSDKNRMSWAERKLEDATQEFLRHRNKALKVTVPCPRCDRVMNHNMGKPWDHRRSVRVRRCKFCLHDFEIQIPTGM